jgi:hypothetical protein
MKRPERQAREDIEKAFPGLMHVPYQVTSEFDERYNCIAHAAGDNRNWWQPDEYSFDFWPILEREPVLTCYQAAYRSLGFEICENAEHETGYEKIAIYVDRYGAPSHAARQLPSGTWTSKLGSWEDIEHPDLQCLEGQAYGRVAAIMRRASELR